MKNEITNPQTTLLSTYVTEETTNIVNLTEEEKKIMNDEEESKKKKTASSILGFGVRHIKQKKDENNDNNNDNNDDDSDDDNSNENDIDNDIDKNPNSTTSSSSPSNLKSTKIYKKNKTKLKDKEKKKKSEKVEDTLAGKYVRIGSGAYVGKLGRAVTHTVGNIYSISVLNIPNEKQGRHTSVTASKLELINQASLNEEESLHVRMDKELLEKRMKKKLQLLKEIIIDNENENNKGKGRGKGKEKKVRLPKFVKDENGNEILNELYNEEIDGDDNVNDDDDDDENNVNVNNNKIAIIDLHKSALDMYIRIKTGRYEGFIARVTGLIGKFRCSVKIVEELNVYTYRGTTVTSSNFHPIDLNECNENEIAMINNDKNIRDSGGSFSSSSLKEKTPKAVFDVDLSGQYVRLLTGKYSGKIARVSTCQIGTSPCNVKVRIFYICEFSLFNCFLF